jgi:hypothetical protein
MYKTCLQNYSLKFLDITKRINIMELPVDMAQGPFKENIGFSCMGKE